MPFQRPTLTQIRAQVAQDITSNLPGSDPLLRFGNLRILGDVLSALESSQYGYLDWIALQAVPFTSRDEFLEAWAALRRVYREPATSASGQVQFTGTNGVAIPTGTLLTRGDGVEYTVTAGATISGGSATVTAVAAADSSGATGAFGNCDVGTILSLGTLIAGVQVDGVASTAFTGGADLESDDSLLSRMLLAYQAPAELGTSADYIRWAREVPGVTRAWVIPNGMGGGTVVVYVMLDQAEEAHGGFPQGTNGVATAELRDTPATGDQLAVANHLYTLQTNTALVYVVAPVAYPIDFTIDNLSGASAGTRAKIAEALGDVLLRVGSPTGTTVNLADFESAIAAVPGTTGFVISSVAGGPPANITPTRGNLPVLGTITYP